MILLRTLFDEAFEGVMSKKKDLAVVCAFLEKYHYSFPKNIYVLKCNIKKCYTAPLQLSWVSNIQFGSQTNEN